MPCPVLQKGRVRGAETRWCSKHTDTSGGSRPSDKGGGGGSHPDPEIRGGPASKKMFSALRASFSSENKGGWPPWVPPLDPPLHTSLIGKVGTNVEVEPHSTSEAQ